MTQINKCKEGPCAVHIINEATGRCVALGADNQLVTEVCSSSSNQTFVIGNTGRAFWSFDLREIKHQVSGRCLTYSPGAPQATVCSSSSPGQSWSFMTGGHDEWIEPEATQGHTLQPHRADFLLRDDARSHRVLTHVRGTTINRYARWTFASAGQSAATEGLQK